MDLIEADQNEKYSYPSMEEEGSILFEYLGKASNEWRTYQIEVLDYSGGTFWIQEGVGWDYWFDQHLELESLPTPGFYVVEGVKGTYFKGDGWTTDDDEEWEFQSVRPATPEEISTNSLANTIISESSNESKM